MSQGTVAPSGTEYQTTNETALDPGRDSGVSGRELRCERVRSVGRGGAALRRVDFR
jgi:hypothetical protein